MHNLRMNTFGELLRQWRTTRRLSQFELALEAEVSPRHISFIETGRAKPSREMVLILANVLALPLRECNMLLQAAGYAAVYRETSLNDPQMAQVRHALELILKQHEPFGAVAFDRRWDILMMSAAYLKWMCLLLGDQVGSGAAFTVLSPPRLNMVRLLFDPGALRPHIKNWEMVAKAVLMKVHRVAVWDRDPDITQLLQSVLAYPGIPSDWRYPDLNIQQDMIIPVEISIQGYTLRLFSTITTLGTPQDVTLQELHIESFHAVDSETEMIMRSLSENIDVISEPVSKHNGNIGSNRVKSGKKVS
ncbi:MAG: helix-turn-helix transcriptional regulator [Acidobacteriota bacterium]